MRKVSFQLVAFLFFLGMAAGCSTQTRIVKTERTEYLADSGQAPPDVIRLSPVATGGTIDQQVQVERGKEPVIVETKTETTTETKEASSGGLLSGTVHVVGQVIALPFHLVGGLIGLIF